MSAPRCTGAPASRVTLALRLGERPNSKDKEHPQGNDPQSQWAAVSPQPTPWPHP
ncbi:hypothetical protein [Streptomyces sp. 1222.5]|uniref:hypothetical protein n=1 Tax=Streptomyces sp. 1222.5 TaxID=1881026 RepID=UPI0015A380F6|nr:hypothetical protein [Streptomyces sp. 1222.5]